MIVRELRRRIHRYFIPSLFFCLTLYFVYSLFQGGRGMFALKGLEEEIKSLQIQRDTLQERHDQLAHKVKLLHPESLCPDLLEERAKEVLGYAHKNEEILIIPTDSEKKIK